MVPIVRTVDAGEAGVNNVVSRIRWAAGARRPRCKLMSRAERKPAARRCVRCDLPNISVGVFVTQAISVLLRHTTNNRKTSSYRNGIVHETNIHSLTGKCYSAVLKYSTCLLESSVLWEVLWVFD